MAAHCKFPYLREKSRDMKSKTLQMAQGMALLLFVMILGGCGATKEPLSAEEWSKMENLITSQNFVFSARWAEPVGGRVNQIDLSGSVNYMSLQGTAIEMELPYFGSSQVAQMGGGRQGMRFQSEATDIRTRKNEKQNFYDMEFKTRNKSESLSCILRMYSQTRAVLTINSSQRNSIRYEGVVQPLQ